MKNRKTKDLKRVLVKKGFELFPEKDHHEFYYLMINGIKQRVYTYFSHGKSEYGDSLMSQIKKQLKFDTTQNAEDFFDCPMTAEQYIEMLKKNNHVKP
ncbi:hypothetical protein VB776_18540 [Arcicella sp. DC2W]|uniref:Type II toxin-antitoxin system HicA family toxin n=1 Tax=Arcicella gelida TaxID=2984195 RepID=A0ABU5S8Y7_9BACT|nr:hypothetical protein [Arcicella sp. DC2W]MEA5404939.1 hypothetical protein [Arcicella sp. DC2W]